MPNRKYDYNYNLELPKNDLNPKLSVFNFYIPLRFRKVGSGVVAHERLTESRGTIEWLLAKSRRFSDLPVFLDLNGRSHIVWCPGFGMTSKSFSATEEEMTKPPPDT